MFYLGGAVWGAYAVAKYALEWDVTVRQFLPFHLGRSFRGFFCDTEPGGLPGSWPKDRLAMKHFLFASFYGSNNEPCLLPDSLENQTRPGHVPVPYLEKRRLSRSRLFLPSNLSPIPTR